MKLYEHQFEHFHKILKILKKNQFYLDLSKMGTGKTYVAGAIARKLELKLIVIGPPSSKGEWIKMSEMAGIELIYFGSYQALRGTEKHPPKHRYLIREDTHKPDKNGKIIHKVQFWITEDFVELVESGILLVFDEFQNIKTLSDQAKAARTLANAVDGKSKCAFLSGSPYDVVDQAANILRVIGVYTQKELVRKVNFSIYSELKGIKEIMDCASKLDPYKTKQIMDNVCRLQFLTPKEARKVAHQLFVGVIKNYVGNEMMPFVSEHKLHTEESYLNLPDKEAEFLKFAVANLKKSVGFNAGTVNLKDIDLSTISKSLASIELATLPALTRFIMSFLRDTTRTDKIIIGLSFLNNIKKMKENFAEYNPLIITGNISADERAKIADKFNSNPKYRVLIMTIRTGGVALSLHDTIGNYCRRMFVIPTYSLIDLYQAKGRIYRAGLKSNCYFYMVYGTQNSNINNSVLPVINALWEKKGVLKSIITKQSQVHKLPGEFDRKFYP